MYKKQILVIDDEKNVCEAITELLKKDYKIVVANSVQESIEKFLTKKPDLIILDINMPDRDGMEMLLWLKKLGYNSPVIIISGLSDLKTVKKSLKLGAYHFLSKPFSVKEFKDVIKEAISDVPDYNENIFLPLNIETLIKQNITIGIKENLSLSPAKKYFAHQLNDLFKKLHFYSI